ncbi:MAG: hypothetical protein AAF191_13085, partial [Verrucomicrobiota bacterium]
VGKDLVIDSTALTNLDSLQYLTEVGGSLQITNNNLLTDLIGLKNIDPAPLTQVSITNNPALAICNASSFLGTLESGDVFGLQVLHGCVVGGLYVDFDIVVVGLHEELIFADLLACDLLRQNCQGEQG